MVGQATRLQAGVLSVVALLFIVYGCLGAVA